MTICNLCGQSLKHFLEYKPVCLRCDELIIDLCLETDEEPTWKREGSDPRMAHKQMSERN